jgi:hypothetical protein
MSIAKAIKAMTGTAYPTKLKFDSMIYPYDDQLGG